MPLVPGSRLDSYEIIVPVGAGGMGEVYRARDTTLKRDVAIKVLPEYWSRDPDRLRRFEQEAQATAALNHPNIVSIFHVGQFNGSPYIVTELLQGESLRERLRKGPMRLREVLDHGVELARGLAAAHDSGIIHRDLKPENIWVTKDGRIKILDFGLAKLDPSKAASTDAKTVTLEPQSHPGQVLGTIGYMAPEQVRGQAADARSDIFALGVIFYEMLTGHRAFKKATSAETLAAILNEDPPPLSQVSSATPPVLQRVISRCLMKNPEQRFQHTSDLAFALEAMSEPSTSSSIVLEKSPASLRAWIILAILTIVVAAIPVAMWLLRPAQPVIEAVKQLTNDGQPKTGFAVFTDGSRIYFNEGAWRMLKIVQIGIDGGEPATIPTSGIGPGARAILTGLAPKGSALLLKTPEAWTRQIPLWELPLPAGAAHPVNGLRVGDASYTPDGRILYTQQGDLFLADSNGSNPRKLVSEPEGVINVPGMSPDGSLIAFVVSNRKDQPDWAFLVRPDGSALRPLANVDTSDGWGGTISWSADSKYLITSRKQGHSTDLWLVPAQTGWLGRLSKPMRLTQGPLNYSGTAVTPDGKEVIAVGTSDRGELVRYDLANQQFVSFLGGMPAFNPTYSADGQWMAYNSYPDFSLWCSRADGSDRLQLTYPPVVAFNPFISPDGKWVVYEVMKEKGEARTYVVSTNGGAPRQVTNTLSWSANWSPDGNFLVFNDATKGWENPEVIILDLRTGETTLVPGHEAGPQWAAPGKFIASQSNETGLQMYDVATQKWSQLPKPEKGSVINWAHSPDFKYFYYTAGTDEAKIYRIRMSDMKTEVVGSLKGLSLARGPDHNSQISVAPDGSPLFTRQVGTEEIYSLTVKWP